MRSSQLVSDPTYQSLPLRRASVMCSIGWPFEHAHFIPGCRHLLDEFEIVLACIVLRVIGDHLQRAFKHHVQRQFMRSRVRDPWA